MKKILTILASCVLVKLADAQTTSSTDTAAAALPAPTPYAVVSRDANSAVWQQQEYQRRPNGTIVTNIHKYVEISTGLNHLRDGQYVLSSENIVISPDGTFASATNCSHQLYFPGNICSGPIKLVEPGGQVIETEPIGLGYSDGSNSVLLAVVTNSTGAILPSGNEVIYTNAFAGLNADLLYRNSKAGMEQDVVIRQSPPDPGSLSLNPASTRLQMLTEFISAPQPGITAATVPTAAGNLEDDSLSFGAMAMGQGKAFVLGANSPSVDVEKRWLTLNRRQFLVEEVPITSVAKALDALPPFVVQTALGTKPVVTRNLVLPPPRLVRASPKAQFLAQATPPSQGLVLDYVTLTSQTDLFQGDTTYYVSGTVNLSGTNTIEGGAVIKYASGASINFSGSPYSLVINCLTGPYRPVIFTAKDDNTVGEIISGSTGNPTGYYYARPALGIQSASAQTISNFRIAYAKQAILADNQTASFYNGQLVNCQSGVSIFSSTVYLRNVLFANVATNFNETSPGTVDVQNGTFNNITNLCSDSANNALTLKMTNCVLANVTYLFAGTYTNAFSADFNGFYNRSQFGSDTSTNPVYPFQSVGAGNYYLTNNCNFLNAGTTNIDPVLLTNLAEMTTWPPAYVCSNTTVSGTWTPQVQRDTNTSPALGYHYAPIDYAVSGVRVNGTLTLNNGVAVATFQTGSGNCAPGLSVGSGDQLASVGTALVHNQLCHYAAVQEQPILWGTNALRYAILVNVSSFTSTAILYARFTDFNGLAGLGTSTLFAYDQEPGVQIGGGDPMEFNLRDCRVGPGWLSCSTDQGTDTNVCVNNLFDRGGIVISDFDGDSPVTVQNNLFHNGYVRFDNENQYYTWTVENNFFDHATLSSGSGLAADYNAYLSTTQLPNDGYPVTVTSFIYATGPLGNYYQGSSNLLYAGSTTAAALGLDHYTVQTNLVGNNEIWEGNNLVSIGFHYLAVNTGGNPLDQDGDGLPDDWEMEYFGQIGLGASTLDGNGNTLLSDYYEWSHDGYSVDPTFISFSIQVTNNYVRTNFPVLHLTVQGLPYYQAVLVDDTNLTDAVWTPYTSTNIFPNLGSTEGRHTVWIGLKAYWTNAYVAWMEKRLKLDLTPPWLTITNPVTNVITQPMIELQGYSAEPLAGISYDITNAAGLMTNQQALVLNQFYDTNVWDYTINAFQAFDIPLTNGLNTITLYATDLAGNVMTTNYNFTVDYSSKTNPPTVQLYWPQDGTTNCGSSFTWRGWVSDFTAAVTAQMVDTNGETNIFEGVVERNGNFWVENLPVGSGNTIWTLIVTDAVGNATTNNITVSAGDLGLSINTPSDDLWNPTITVNGTINDYAHYTVWVNGMKANYTVGGAWEATNVPLPVGGTAVIQARAIPNSQNGGNGSGGNGGGPVSYGNLGNPNAPNEQDAEIAPDRPSRLPYVATYNLTNKYYCSYSETWENKEGFGGSVQGSSFDYELVNWADGNGSLDFSLDDKSSGSAGCGTGPFNLDSPSAGQVNWPYVDGMPPPSVYCRAGASSQLYLSLNGEMYFPYDGWGCYVPPLKKDDSQTIKYCQRQEQATLILQTGGKPVPGRQNLWRISGQAQDIPVTVDTLHLLPCNDCFLNLETTDIPSQSLRVLNRWLGSGGYFYTTLPYGGQFAVTVEAPGHDFYQFQPNADEYHPHIETYCTDEHNLDDETPTFCVGQQVGFELHWAPTAPGEIVDYLSRWTLPQKFVNEPTNYWSGSPACVIYDINWDLLTNNSTSCWFVNGPGGSVSMWQNLHFSNGQYLSIAANGNITVFRPQKLAENMCEDLAPNSITIMDPCLYVTNIGMLSLGDAHGGYPRFVAGYQAKPGDTFRETQIVQSYRKYGTTTVNSGSSWWFDSQATKPGTTSPVESDGIGFIQQTDKFPGIPLIPPEAKVNDIYRTYFQYQPASGGIWVTLGCVYWSWADDATYNGSNWNIPPGTISFPQYFDEDDFPLWTGKTP